jgi:inorganic pyrophosphatase
MLLAAAVIFQEYRLRKVVRTVAGGDKKADNLNDTVSTMPAITIPSDEAREARELVERLFPVHAWHGVPPGEDAPNKVNAVIEITPDDRVKFELDKHTGMLCVDRPQKYVNGCPVMYGFIPRSLCKELVGKHCAERTGIEGILGDGDPIDICVLTEKGITHGNILLRARPIGGLRMIDESGSGEKSADDKIVAVLEGDMMFGKYTDISQLEPDLVDRLKHYFITYKQPPGEVKRKVEITHVYGPEEARSIIGYSLQDYRNHYGDPESRFEQLVQLIIKHMNRKPA